MSTVISWKKNAAMAAILQTPKSTPERLLTSVERTEEMFLKMRLRNSLSKWGYGIDDVEILFETCLRFSLYFFFRRNLDPKSMAHHLPSFGHGCLTLGSVLCLIWFEIPCRPFVGGWNFFWFPWVVGNWMHWMWFPLMKPLVSGRQIYRLRFQPAQQLPILEVLLLSVPVLLSSKM